MISNQDLVNGENPTALDKLSNLPSHVVDEILCRLPIRDAVRTSVLSSKWRFKWTTMPNLVFDKDCFSFTPHGKRVIKKKLVNLIDQTLLLHTGPISKFMLYQRDPISTNDMDRWILHLSRRSVQEFMLETWEGPRYKLHSRLFSFQDLVHLDLYACHLKLPSTFGGFMKLKSLNLECLTVAQDAFETLISSCPILERLALAHVDGFTHLNIDAPNLSIIDFKGYFDDLNFINSSNLALLLIQLEIGDNATKRIKAQDSSNLLKFLSSLPCSIKVLAITGNFLEYLATGDMQGQLPNRCLNLGYLEVHICLDDYAESSTALYLLRSSPDIKKFVMNAVHLSPEAKEFTFWESEDKNCSFNSLRTVNISGISGSKNELEFIRFMLLASPVLQKMTLKPSSENQALQVARKLLMFQRTSTKAEVLFLESSTDD